MFNYSRKRNILAFLCIYSYIALSFSQSDEQHYSEYGSDHVGDSHIEYLHGHSKKPDYNHYDDKHVKYVPVEHVHVMPHHDSNDMESMHHFKENSHYEPNHYHDHSNHQNTRKKYESHSYDDVASWNAEKAYHIKDNEHKMPENPHEACMNLHEKHYNDKHICCSLCDGFWDDREIWSCKRRPEMTDVVGVFHRVQLFSHKNDMNTIRAYAIHVQSTHMTRAYLHNGFLEPICDLTADSGSYPWHKVQEDMEKVFGHLAAENSIMSVCQKLAPISSHYSKGFVWVGPQYKRKSGESGYSNDRENYHNHHHIHKGESGLFVHPYSIFAAYEGVQVHILDSAALYNKGVAFFGPAAPMGSCSDLHHHHTSIECSEPSLEVKAGSKVQAYKPIHVFRLELVPNISEESVTHIHGWIGYPKSFPGASMSALMIHGGALFMIEQSHKSFLFAFKRLEVEPDHWPPQEKYGVTYKLKNYHSEHNEVQAFNLAVDIFSSGYTGYGRATFRLIDGHFRIGHYDNMTWKVRGSSHVHLKGDSITMEPEINSNIVYTDHEPIDSQHMGLILLTCRKICFVRDHLYYAKAHYPVDVWRFKSNSH